MKKYIALLSVLLTVSIGIRIRGMEMDDYEGPPTTEPTGVKYPFLAKLVKIVNKTNTEVVITWDEGKNKIVVPAKKTMDKDYVVVSGDTEKIIFKSLKISVPSFAADDYDYKPLLLYIQRKKVEGKYVGGLEFELDFYFHEYKSEIGKYKPEGLDVVEITLVLDGDELEKSNFSFAHKPFPPSLKWTTALNLVKKFESQNVNQIKIQLGKIPSDLRDIIVDAAEYKAVYEVEKQTLEKIKQALQALK